MFGQRLASAEATKTGRYVEQSTPRFRAIERAARAALADWQASQKPEALPGVAEAAILTGKEPTSHDLLDRLLKLKAENDPHHLIGMLCEKLAVAMDRHPDVKEAIAIHIRRLELKSHS